jgi:hypothetical protein
MFPYLLLPPIYTIYSFLIYFIPNKTIMKETLKLLATEAVYFRVPEDSTI